MSMVIPIVLLKKKGFDPHGSHEVSSLLTRLSSFSAFAWLFYIILYIFIDQIIKGFDGIIFLINDFSIILGIILVSLGFIFEGLGIKELGINFRIELPKEKIELVTSGIYRMMRNPIVFGVYLLLIGSFFIIPTITSLLLLIAIIITFNSKAKDEEKFLSTKFGKKYEDYRRKVGRYLPFIIKRNKNNKTL